MTDEGLFFDLESPASVRAAALYLATYQLEVKLAGDFPDAEEVADYTLELARRYGRYIRSGEWRGADIRATALEERPVRTPRPPDSD